MATRHSEEHRGLQQHSVGTLYPWSVVHIGDKRCEARNLVTGECVYRVHIVDGDRRRADRLCELWIEQRLGLIDQETEVHKAVAEGPYISGMRDLADNAGEPANRKPESLSEYSIIVPFARDTTGEKQYPESWEKLEERLIDNFWGFTTTRVCGQWRDSTGKIVEDKSRCYSFSTNDSETVLAIAHWCKSEFDQQCIYVSKSATDVQLV